jgi:hypothetical protein
MSEIGIDGPLLMLSFDALEKSEGSGFEGAFWVLQQFVWKSLILLIKGMDGFLFKRMAKKT